jgi:cysteine desulfurase
MGFSTDFLTVDGEGRLNCEDLALKLTESTRLVSVMYANNETGNIYPVKAIAEMAHSRGALFHTDAVQAMGKIPVNVADLGVDLLSLSAHKMRGPKGTGALYVRSGVPIHPIIDGGGQERGHRSGTEHVPGIIGLGKACQIIRRDGENQRIHMAGLRDRLEQGLLASLKDMYINGDISHRIPNTSNISFMGLEGESVAISLDLEGIEVSSGSACGTGAKGDSHVLTAMGLDEGRVRSAVRFSIGAENTMEEIETVIHIVPEVVAEMRELSPRWRMEKS